MLCGTAVLPDDVVNGGEELEVMQGHVISVMIPKPSPFPEAHVLEGRV